MDVLAAASEPSGLDLVLPGTAELLWGVLGLLLLAGMVAGVVALIVMVVRSSQRADVRVEDLGRRVRVLEEQAHHQKVE